MTDSSYDIEARRDLLGSLREQEDAGEIRRQSLMNEVRSIREQQNFEASAEPPSLLERAKEFGSHALRGLAGATESGVDDVRVGREAVEQAQIAIDQHNLRLEGIFGKGNFAPGEGLEDFGFRFDAARSDKFSEVVRKFQKKFPNGSMFPMELDNGELGVFYRKENGEPWREFKPPDTSPIPSVGDLGTIAGATVSEPTAAGVAGFAMAGPVGGGIGTALGVGAQSQIEDLRGFEDSTTGEVIKQAVTEGSLALAFDAGIGIASRVAQLGVPRGKGSALFKKDASFEEAVAGAQRQELDPLAIGQVGKTLTRRAFRQTGGTNDTVKDLARDQVFTLRTRLQQNITEAAIEGFGDVELARLTYLQAKEVENNVLDPFAKVTSTEAGAAQETARRNFKRLGRAWVDRKYADAFAVTDNASFNFGKEGGVKEAAQG